MHLIRAAFVALLALSACGAPCEHPDGGSGPTDSGTAACDAMGRTCESAFGVYTLETVTPRGCSLLGAPNSLNLSAFDGGSGSAVWQGQSPMPMSRLGCQYVGRYSTSSQDIELTYDPACNVLRGKVQVYSSSSCPLDGGAVWADVIGRKP
ncbi:MAG: hypothetical protein ACOZQL_11640 [Myxococcota bacterium]